MPSTSARDIKRLEHASMPNLGVNKSVSSAMFKEYFERTSSSLCFSVEKITNFEQGGH